MLFAKESESKLFKKNAENTESNFENKDKQTEKFEKQMGAKERIEQVSHEVKSTQKQMQNIMANMQQVVKAVQTIRIQLGLISNGSIPSVDQDEKGIEDLKKKLANLKNQFSDLEHALKTEEKQSVLKEHNDWSEKQVEEIAEKRVREILKNLEID